MQPVFAGFRTGPLEAEIAADQPQVGADRGSMVEQALRRLRIGAQGRLAGTEDACLLEADAFAIRPQPVGVVKGNRGDDGNIGFVGVDRIQPTTESDFENRGI